MEHIAGALGGTNFIRGDPVTDYYNDDDGNDHNDDGNNSPCTGDAELL